MVGMKALAAEKRMQRAEGVARLRTQTREGRTRISTLYQEGCAKIRLPCSHTDALEAVQINTAGGLTGGDQLEWQFEAAAGSALVITTQACERIYRSTGEPAHVTSRLTAGTDSRVDWLPQETILFEGSKLRRSLEVDLSDGATLCAIESVLLGREAMGEAARSALLDDNWRVRRNGKLIHAEANRLSANDLERDALSLLAGNRAFATILLIAADAEQRVGQVRALIPSDAKAAVSGMGERLIVRLLAPSSLALRRLSMPILASLSQTGNLPRLWTT